MRRVVVGYDDFAFGHRAIARFGTSHEQAADDLFISDGAPTAAHSVPGVGRVFGVAIAPESEVRSCEILAQEGGRIPVYEGRPSCVRRRIDDCGSLVIDALEAHDGTLVLICAETPDECDALPWTEVLNHRTAAFQYNSATANYRAFALPQSPTSQAQWSATVPATAESRANQIWVSGKYVDDGTTTSGDHTLDWSLVWLRRRPLHAGGGDVLPTPIWQETDPVGGAASGSVTVSGNTPYTSVSGNYCRIIAPSPGLRGVLIAVTSASSEPDQAARTLHRITCGRGM